MSNKEFTTSLGIEDEEIPLLHEVMEEVEITANSSPNSAASHQEIIDTLQPKMEKLVGNVASRAAKQFEKKVYDKLLHAILEKLPAMIDQEIAKRR